MEDSAEISPVRVGAELVAAASASLARAMRGYPLMRYFEPRDARHERAVRECCRRAVEYGRRYGEVCATSPRAEGAAVWLPPDEARSSIGRMVRAGGWRLPFAVGPGLVTRFLSFYGELAARWKRIAPFPHWYLQLLGVDPEHQGQGHAGRLLESVFRRLDAQHAACCLDTETPENAVFYERFGFRVVEHYTIRRSEVDCWMMMRGASPGR